MGFSGFAVGSLVNFAVSAAERIAPRQAFKFKKTYYRPDMGFSLEVLKRGGYRPGVALDLGAYRGDWALLCRSVFPGVNILMVEPAPERAAALEKLCLRQKNLSVVRALAGAEGQRCYFQEQESNSAVVKMGDGAVEMTSRSLDAIVRGTPFSRPDLMKLDVQGYEFEVLKGAAETLKSVTVIVMELSLIPLHSFAPSFRDAVEAMDGYGFRLFDICGFIRRPVDDALWQIDAVFVRKDGEFGRAERGW
ncbi:MAG TPA: FkbM family methyltransferase [Candidatus Eisenbacteria bacterium]|jgi:FkbM family methyltransferase|nr:FkbM family methyltransferase [Candidatus Eisenbacteria bacterium]